MINRLLGDWHSRLKYVDDTTVFEIMPRNSTSLLDFAVRDIHKYCIEHSMRLNPRKCKEMVVNFKRKPEHYNETPVYRKPYCRKTIII